MRQSREAKAETHKAIVTQASRLFRERGIEGTSVADVMEAARKTHGGFYRHFESKEALLSAALEDAFAGMLDDIDQGFANTPPGERFGRFLATYLSPEMIDDVGGGCPVAALSGDVPRSTEGVRDVFGSGVRRIIDAIAETLEGPLDERMRRAAQTFSMAAGAAMIARASDLETAAMVLGAVRRADPMTPLRRADEQTDG